jgi:imidazolonepropionase-like amidohydrolase
MILVNGNPTTNISDFRKVDSVIRGGAVLYPREVYSAVEVRGQ